MCRIPPRNLPAAALADKRFLFTRSSVRTLDRRRHKEEHTNAILIKTPPAIIVLYGCPLVAGCTLVAAVPYLPILGLQYCEPRCRWSKGKLKTNQRRRAKHSLATPALGDDSAILPLGSPQPVCQALTVRRVTVRHFGTRRPHVAAVIAHQAASNLLQAPQVRAAAAHVCWSAARNQPRAAVPCTASEASWQRLRGW